MPIRARSFATACLALAALAADPLQGQSDHALTLAIYRIANCGSPHASGPLRIDGMPTDYCLAESALIDQRDVSAAAINQRAAAKDQPVVELTLREDAAARVLQETRTGIGNRLAEVVNGSLISVAIIAGPTSTISISRLTPAEAAAFIDAFAKGAQSASPPPALPPGPPPPIPTTTPILIYRQDPVYTPEARQAGIQGFVLLEAVIQPDGTVTSIRVLKSLDPGLDAKAVESLRAYRFRPALRDGQPVEKKVTFDISFRLP